MASLTPGTLQKLLQNVGNKDFKVAGEHRSALLQVISIVPSLEDDPWKSRGYFLRVSDSVHSAYVSVSDEDVELILSDKIQLGQFIHVTWLDSGSPVPVLRGIKPIPKRRPCVGDPKDLISSDFLNAKKVEIKAKSKGKVRKLVGDEQGNGRRLSFGNGKVGGGGVEVRRLSLDSVRKGWDSSPLSKNVVKSVSKLKSNGNCSPSDFVVVKKAIPEDSPKSSSLSPLGNKNIIVSPKLLIKPVKNIKSPSDGDIFPIDFNKVPIRSKKWSEQKISWDALPSTIRDLGKEVRSYKNIAFISAARALEEASISEDVIRCMSMFAELRELTQRDTSGPLVEQFLNIHERIKKASTVISTLLNLSTSDPKDSKDCSFQESEKSICFTPVSKNASLWVQAAVQTDFSKFSLYAKGGEKGVLNGEKCHYLVLENTSEKVDRENHSPKIKQNRVSSSKTITKVKEVTFHSKRRLSTMKGKNDGQEEAWLPGSRLKHVASLAEKLLSCTRAWFLDYLEDSLHNEFGLERADSSQIAVLLRQLKRVNKWLDDAFQGDGVDERIERLKKKLCRFLLDHVDSAVSHR